MDRWIYVVLSVLLYRVEYSSSINVVNNCWYKELTLLSLSLVEGSTHLVIHGTNVKIISN